MKNDNQIKVLLINPPSEFKTPVLPLGLASIAAYLEKNKIDVSILDAWAEKISFEELKNKISQSEVDIIGIYMVSPRYEPQLDICAIGEGEITMYELVKSLQSNSELSRVDGIAYRDKNNGQIIITKTRDFIKNLDTLPLPARHLFPIEKYRTHPPYGRKNPYFSIITSRGCPFQCAYCSKDVFKNIFRARSSKNVCDEIDQLINKYNAQEIHFYDDDFTMNMNRAEEICDEILRRGLKFIWSCTTRVDLVNEKLLRKMKQAGCWLISYGVESGNQQILDAINKEINIDQIISAFEITKKVGISTLAYFMAGLPGETAKTIQETIDLSKKIKPDFVSWGILVVYPGSRLFKLIQKGKYPGRLKILDKGKSLSGTFFGKGNYIVFEDNLTLKQLRAAIKKANREFYLRPLYIFQCLKSIRSFSDFSYYLNGGIEVIKSAMG
jgi:radical SAM superfamily enzyme YgiQ (UPF0313 family)